MLASSFVSFILSCSIIIALLSTLPLVTVRELVERLITLLVLPPAMVTLEQSSTTTGSFVLVIEATGIGVSTLPSEAVIFNTPAPTLPKPTFAPETIKVLPSSSSVAVKSLVIIGGL